MWIYVKSEPGLYTVGHYAPDGTWHPDSDHVSKETAANRVRWLNGGNDYRPLLDAAKDLLEVCELVQWGDNLDGWACCPVCMEEPSKGHSTFCKLANAIAKAKGD